MRFRDRVDAGRQLAQLLAHLRSDDVVVLGLPRGGVPVAAEVAHALGAPLDVLVVRKVGVPFQPELAMGAVGESGVRVRNDDVVRIAHLSPDELAAAEGAALAELERRTALFRRVRPRVPLEGKIAVVVDDGVATGSTARAACLVARALGARRVVLAVPVAPRGWEAAFRGVADELVALATPEGFMAVGQYYVDFRQTGDDEVVSLLRAANPDRHDEDVDIRIDGLRLGGRLTVPEGATGVVVFAHGSGSSRHSPRNRYVAGVLQGAGLATLLFDLLTAAEERDRANVFDIDLLGQRLLDVTRWLHTREDLGHLPFGYFGASTGAAAALWAAADPTSGVGAVVSRGGRPDLARDRLGDVRAPTLLIVGGEDHVVLDLNRRAIRDLRCHSELAVVPGATHLFEEAGTLAAAATLARDWFHVHLGRARR